MKRTTLLTLLTIFSLVAKAQFPQDFNTICLTNAVPGNGWTIYNPPSTAGVPNGMWRCAATEGEPTTTGGLPTPGVKCSGLDAGIYHLDTSYLISPFLYFSSTTYPGGHVYLHFESKRETISHSGRLSLVKVPDTLVTAAITLDSSLSPFFTGFDSAGWVRHELDLSHYIDSPVFYVAFRFTSTTAAGTAWYLDNMSISANSVAGVADKYADKSAIPISIIGDCTSSQIALSYTATTAGAYKIAVYDMVGREVYKGQVDAKTGTSSYIINGINLSPGMYCVKMGNANTYGTAKLMIQ